MDFLQKLLAWFSKFYLRVRSKNCVRNSFLIFLLRFFSDFERKIFQTFGRKTSRLCQNYLLRLQRKNLWLDFFFLSFESFPIFCRNLWHGSQNSIYESRLKIVEKTIFFVFFSELFWLLSENFSDFWPNLQNLSKLPSECPEEQFVALNFLKSFEPFWIFYRNFWHGSQNSIYVSRVKIALETVFLFFFSDFFRILSETSLRLSAKKLQKVVKTTFCVSTGTTCGFKFFSKNFDQFWIFYRNFWHGSQNSIYVSGVRIALETVFLFFFSDFFRILSEKYFRLLAEKRQDFVKITFYVSRGKICGLIFFF